MCAFVQAGPPPAAPVQMPAVMGGSQPLAQACQAQPAHQGQNNSGVVVMNPQAQGIPGQFSGSPLPAVAPATSYPAQPVAPHPSPAAPAAISGCCVCGSDDVQYVLETTVGQDATTLAQGHTIRAGFCSPICLAQKLGLVAPNGGLAAGNVDD